MCVCVDGCVTQKKMSNFLLCCCFLLASSHAPLGCERLLDDGDHGVVDVNEVDVSEAGASPTLTFKLEDGRQVTLCTDLLGHSEYSCQQGKGQTS